MAIVGLNKTAKIPTASSEIAEDGTTKEKKPRMTQNEKILAALQKVQDELGAECTDAVRRVFEQNKALYGKGTGKATTIKSLGKFYGIFGEKPEEGAFVPAHVVMEKLGGMDGFRQADAKKWASSGVPYGKGSTAVIQFIPSNETTDGVAGYKLVSYVEKRNV